MNSCFFLFTGPIPPSKSIPQLQEDPTQTITTSTTAEPEHQTPTSTIATLKKETTVTRETGILQLLLSTLCRVCNEKKLNLPALWEIEVLLKTTANQMQMHHTPFGSC